jgi:hypothetical protein
VANTLKPGSIEPGFFLGIGLRSLAHRAAGCIRLHLFRTLTGAGPPIIIA